MLFELFNGVNMVVSLRQIVVEQPI